MRILLVRLVSLVLHAILISHYAAHERKVPNRLANLAKIKVRKSIASAFQLTDHHTQAELDVEDYLEAEDPRMVAEGQLPDSSHPTLLF